VSTSTDVIRAARSLVGRPFLHQGRGALGIDCVGLLVTIAVMIGSPLKDRAGYAPSPDPMLLRDQLDSQLTRSDKCPLGCVLGFLRIGQGLQHVGVMVQHDPFLMVHAVSSRGIVVDEIDSRWVKHRAGSWLFKGVDY
jgi:cell wall-associated NlpC family hydrolase